MSIGFVIAVPLLDTTASSPTEPFAAFKISCSVQNCVASVCSDTVYVGWLRPALAPLCTSTAARHTTSVKSIVYLFRLHLPRDRTPRLTLLRVPWSLPLPSLRGLCRLVCAMVFGPPRTPAMHFLARSASYQLLRTPVGARSQAQTAGGHLLLHERPERVLACWTRPKPRSVTEGAFTLHSHTCTLCG